MGANGFSFKLLTPATFPDFERLFAPAKGCSGCWCMYYRLESKRWRELQGDGCREAMRDLVQRGEARGLLAYAGGEPVGWCTFGPRGQFPRLDRTKICQGLDNPDGLWSLPCFFIARSWRGKGLSRLLLAEALAEMRRAGARIVEAYPVTTTRDGRRVQAEFAWTGPLKIHEEAGFTVVSKVNPLRPVMRKVLQDKKIDR